MNPPTTSRLPRSERGSLLIVAMLLCAIIGVSLVSYYKLAATTLKGSTRSFLSMSNLDLAEIGVEQAMACFYDQSTGTASATAWTGWTLSGTTAKRTFSGYVPAPNCTGVVRVYVYYYTNSGGTPVIVAKATITPPDGPPLDKFIEVTLRNRGLWSTGLVGKTSVRMNSNARADSWMSDPDSDASTAAVAYSSGVRRDNGTVGTPNSANGSITMDSNAEIYGTANTGGGTVTTNSNVRIYGASSPSSPKVDTSRVHTDFNYTFPAITVPAPTTVNTISTSVTAPRTFPQSGDNINASDGKYYYSFGSGNNINMDSNKNLTIDGKVVWLLQSHLGVDAIHTSSNADTVFSGTTSTLEIYTNGNITLDSNNDINASGQPSRCLVYGTSATTQTFTLSSNVNWGAAIYAPNMTFRIDSNCSLFGSVVANTIQMDSNAAFHYDESLGNLGGGTGVSVSKWKELQSAADRATYASVLNF
ncbi:MAG: hypothetical protein HY302_16350 [Opitutae bacterium]|nr:hypothetical protein [Opitutae bacterium]